jgi:hypothetical protein
VAGAPLPFPAHLPSEGARALLGDLHETPLETGVAATIEQFSALISSGMMAPTSTEPNVVR